MAVITEIMGDLTRTYSDSGFMIEGGEPHGLYSEAIDPTSEARVYVETNIPVPVEDPDATVEDYEQALSELGVTDDEEG